MAGTATPIFPQSLVNTGVSLTHGTGLLQFGATNTATGTMVPFFVPGANGAVLTAVMASCTDTATCTMALILSTSAGASTFVQAVGFAAIAGSGTATAYNVFPTNLLNGTQGVLNLPYDSCGNKILYVAAGSTLNVGLLSTIIWGTGQLNISALGGNF